MEQEKRKFEKKVQSLLTIIVALFCLVCILLTILVIATVCEDEQTEEVVETTTEEVTEAVTIPAPRISADGPGECYYYHVSDEEKIMLAKLVFAESGFEPFEGQVAVVAVVLNRYHSNIPYFDKESIASIITQKSQFASISKITMKNLEDNPSCMEAVEAACKGWDPTRAKFPKGALYFYAPALVPSDFQEGVEKLSIGNVNFHYDYKLY